MRVRTKDGEGFVQRILEVGAEKRVVVVIDRPNKQTTRFYKEDEVEPINECNLKVMLREAKHIVQLIEDMIDDSEL